MVANVLLGNDITKVEGLEELHDLRELVLDRNKIKGISEYSLVNQWNLQELHLEENRVREISNVGCLENLQRLFLGQNRIQDITELEKLENMPNLIELSVVNNAVSMISWAVVEGGGCTSIKRSMDEKTGSIFRG